LHNVSTILTLISQSQIYFEAQPCVITVEISCLKESIEVLVAEDYIPTAHRYDHRHEVTSQESHATQLTFRSSKANAEKIYVMVRSFSRRSAFKIWGYCSAPQRKYGGSDDLDRIISRLEDFISPGRNDNLMAVAKAAEPFAAIAEPLTNASIKQALHDDPSQHDMRELDNVLTDIGLASLREASAQSHRGMSLNRNSHELLVRNKAYNN
jgi:hypothetical protein